MLICGARSPSGGGRSAPTLELIYIELGLSGNYSANILTLHEQDFLDSCVYE